MDRLVVGRGDKLNQGGAAQKKECAMLHTAILFVICST
jgi:hypothetical protein